MTEKTGCVQHDCAECRARLAQPEHEPDYLMDPTGRCHAPGGKKPLSAGYADNTYIKLWATPPKRPWVGLTADDRWEILYATEQDERVTVMQLVEAKLKEKNT